MLYYVSFHCQAELERIRQEGNFAGHLWNGTNLTNMFRLRQWEALGAESKQARPVPAFTLSIESDAILLLPFLW